MSVLQTESLERNTAFRAAAVTPNDGTDLPGGAATCGLYVTVTGNVSFDVGGTTVSLLAVPVLTRLPFAATRVRSTGTTATVLALY